MLCIADLLHSKPNTAQQAIPVEGAGWLLLEAD